MADTTPHIHMTNARRYGQTRQLAIFNETYTRAPVYHVKRRADLLYTIEEINIFIRATTNRYPSRMEAAPNGFNFIKMNMGENAVFEADNRLPPGMIGRYCGIPIFSNTLIKSNQIVMMSPDNEVMAIIETDSDNDDTAKRRSDQRIFKSNG